jgi:hypothetical protein
MGDLRVLLMPEQDMQSKNQVLLINHPKYSKYLNNVLFKYLISV